MKSILFEPPSRRQEGGGAHDQDKATEAAHGFRNPLELSLRISSGVMACNVGGGDSGECRGLLATRDNLVVHRRDQGAKEWLPAEIHSGFIHPWSLAARQQKAVFEQASSAPRDAHPSSSTPPPPPPPLLVGWPPVRTSRKHLSLLKPGMDGENDAKRRKLTEREATTVLTTESRSRPAMFVKVNMEGYVVGRKIDLGAHESYRSLYRALSKLLRNFLSCTGARMRSANYSNNSGEQDDEVADDDFVLLYEDSEGDQMLVGDIPWELFITSVKKLYIAHGRKKAAAGGEAQKTHHKQQLNH
ncbi:auxin-responsive protein IAA25-like isoform X1 [Musa acuminata AAA Group]|uniref:auxin-responsive protein IAA25-like isoform X1 n=1 Tax=Musa acuminata AAA Group TaxID=214697 RepID=UPI0031E04A40